MAKIDMYTMDGKVSGSLELSDEIFAVEPNQDLLHRVVVNQLANRRQGTHKTKGRSEVRGGGRKPYRQKGTGRARQGSIRAAQHVGGGVIFGPTPRNYRYTLPKKMRRAALKSAFTLALQNDKIKVLEKLELEEIKTKKMVEVMNNLNVDGSALIIMTDRCEKIEKSSANIPTVKTELVQTINVYDLLKYDNVIFTKDAVEKVEEVFI